MKEAKGIELLYDVWEQNIETLRVCTGIRKRDQATFQSWSRICELAPSPS